MADVKDLFVEGQLLHKAGRFSEAETLLRRVLASQPDHVPAWYYFGLSCHAQGKLADASEALERTLALMPNHAPALAQLGNILMRQHRYVDAAARFRHSIELRPQHAKTHNNLGVAMMQLGHFEEGLLCYQEAIRQKHDYAEAHFNLGCALAERKRAAEAIASYERALHFRPDYADALHNLGLILAHERRPAEAAAAMEQAARLKPENVDTKVNLSLAYTDLGRFDDAIFCCDVALRVQPFNSRAHINRGSALLAAGRADEAMGYYELALKLEPENADAHFNRSICLLTMGDYERGWPEYEWRWKRAGCQPPNFSAPLWDGTSLEGKTILLWCEQGLGDMIQFVRYAGEVKKRGATVWLECPAKMIGLFSTCSGIDRIFADGTALPRFDCQAPLMSVPALCKTTLSTVPADIPYLFGDPVRVERWRNELDDFRHFKIGIAWQGKPDYRWDRHRSLDLFWFESLANIEGVKLFSMQKGPGVKQLESVSFPIVDFGHRLDENNNAFQDTAAVMLAMDLIITCDSALAHLAGALGVPVWVPLPVLADWRWLYERQEIAWYSTMRLFRQRNVGAWHPVFERMCRELIARIRP